MAGGHQKKTGKLAVQAKQLHRELAAFCEFGQESASGFCAPEGSDAMVPVYANEFWTSKQRVGHSLHEISYRACFKPQLPHFFMERLTQPGDCVYDPFMGRGTTLLEAALMGRRPVGCDINPLGAILVAPRLNPPDLEAVRDRLANFDWAAGAALPVEEDLLAFFHPETLRELSYLRDYLIRREADGTIDAVDRWIRMVAVNRLTGHSKGFFSVYTLPPNQSVSVESQRRINEKRAQEPDRRNVGELIFRKSKALLKSLLDEPFPPVEQATLLTADARHTADLADASVDLVVTSPPFLNVVDYAQDNWMRGWFCGFDTAALNISVTPKIPVWSQFICDTFRELSRVLKPGGWIAFEVGEVDKGTVKLEEHVIPAAQAAGLCAELVLINEQGFTKTANCWGIDNNRKGTNSNRVVLLHHG